MNVRTILTSAVALTLTLILAAPVGAAIFLDDFNDDTGTLLGETANTGQVWGDTHPIGSRPDMDTGTTYGQGGTVGIGSTGEWKEQDVMLGQTITDASGTYQFSVDINSTAGFAGEIGLNSQSGGWSGGYFRFEWLATGSLLVAGLQGGSTTVGTFSNLHVDYVFDLVNEEGWLNWYNIDNPSVNGSLYMNGLNQTGLGLYGIKATTSTLAFDNVSLTLIPEPGTCTLMLLGLGMAVVGLRRSRRR